MLESHQGFLRDALVADESLAPAAATAPLQLHRPKIPGLRAYYVLALHTTTPSAGDAASLFPAAHVVARTLARQHFGDPDCYSLLFNGARTRRMPWPHVHIILAPSVSAKRRALLVLHLKHLSRWRRWPVVARWRSRFLGGTPRTAAAGRPADATPW